MSRIVTVTTEYTVCKFEELSDEAKEAVKRWYLNDPCMVEMFTENCEQDLENLFPKSELKVEYSLNYCQGDGFNIYGKIYLDEVLEKIADKFTEKEMKFFKWVFNEYGSSYKMESNRHYCYCICSRNDFSEDILCNMEDDNMRGIPTETLKKFNKLVGEYLDNLCKEFEKEGYSFLYEISDEDMQETCEANEWEFTADGSLFTA